MHTQRSVGLPGKGSICMLRVAMNEESRISTGVRRRAAAPPGRILASNLCLLLLLALPLSSCRSGEKPRDIPVGHSAGPSVREAAFLDTLEARTFRYFWDLSDSKTGLTPDRWPTKSFASVGAIGFALTAYPIGAERGYVTRDAAGDRVLATLRFLRDAPQNSKTSGSAGYHGFFYHFLDPETGRRFKDVELSTMDTALLVAGALFCETYFDRESAPEDSIRSIAAAIYGRVDWKWAQVRPPTIALGWLPESGFLPYDWRGYNESMLLHVLALGSPTHPATGDVWNAWLENCRWGSFQGTEHVGFAPLFGHQYAQCWIDLRGIGDVFIRGHGIDYFENSRRATLAQQAYAVSNPGGWAGYGERRWGLTAGDGPVDRTLDIDGKRREFHTYWARGASFTEVNDDGTLSPSAVGGSIAFAPEVVLPTLISMRETYGARLFSTYGFLDGFNPTLKLPIKVPQGRIDPALGWFDTDYLGIDEGPILIMIENYRSGLVWKTMRRNAAIARGLRAAGFRGGWLDPDGSVR